MYSDFFRYVLFFFALSLPVTLWLSGKVDELVAPLDHAKYYSFGTMFLLLLPFCWDKTNRLVWWILAVVHGVAHLIHPAFHGTVPNPNYTPLWDFIVHAIECLCIHAYHCTTMSKIVSTVTFFTTFFAGLTAHIYGAEFMTNPLWLVLSGGGVLGATYHMNLLNEHHSKHVLFANYFIWFAPYVGYLKFEWIPEWDNLMNRTSLFQLWFWAYFVAAMMANKFMEKGKPFDRKEAARRVAEQYRNQKDSTYPVKVE